MDAMTPGGRPRRRKANVSDREIGQAAAAGLGGALVGGRDGYDRRRMLPRLIAIDLRQLDAGGDALDRLIEARLKRALRAERRRGRAGHWTYDLNRHIALLQALAGESGRSSGSAEAHASPSRRTVGRPPETKNAARRSGRRS